MRNILILPFWTEAIFENRVVGSVSTIALLVRHACCFSYWFTWHSGSHDTITAFVSNLFVGFEFVVWSLLRIKTLRMTRFFRFRCLERLFTFHWLSTFDWFSWFDWFDTFSTHYRSWSMGFLGFHRLLNWRMERIISKQILRSSALNCFIVNQVVSML